MRILMTTDTMGGVWTYSIELAGELARHGVQVCLATVGDPPRAQQRREAHAVPGLNLFESTHHLEWMDDPGDDVKQAGEWLLYLDEVTRPDVIHLNGYVHAALPFKAPTIVVAHSCLLSWHQAVKRTAVPESWRTYETAARRGLLSARAVVAPTCAMLDSIIANYGELPRTQVIPNGRRSFGGEHGPKWPFILCAGRLWDEAKNVSLLEEAAPRLSWPVWLAGEVTLSHSRPSRYRNNINLLGQLPFAELARWLGRAAIYCLPAKYEPFGLGPLEAGLSGCALVLGDIASLREVWGKAALYVPTDNRDVLVDTLQELIQQPALCEKYGQLARERAARYSPDRMATAYLALYRKLVEPSRDGATGGLSASTGTGRQAASGTKTPEAAYAS